MRSLAGRRVEWESRVRFLRRTPALRSFWWTLLLKAYALLVLWGLFAKTEARDLEGDFLFLRPGESREEKMEKVRSRLVERLAPLDGQWYLDIALRGLPASFLRGAPRGETAAGEPRVFPAPSPWSGIRLGRPTPACGEARSFAHPRCGRSARRSSDLVRGPSELTPADFDGDGEVDFASEGAVFWTEGGLRLSEVRIVAGPDPFTRGCPPLTLFDAGGGIIEDAGRLGSDSFSTSFGDKVQLSGASWVLPVRGTP